MKYTAILLAILLSGCAGFHETVEITKQSHKVNSIERDIKSEQAKQIALTGTVVLSQDKLSESRKEEKELKASLEQEKIVLQELVK